MSVLNVTIFTRSKLWSLFQTINEDISISLPRTTKRYLSTLHFTRQKQEAAVSIRQRGKWRDNVPCHFCHISTLLSNWRPTCIRVLTQCSTFEQRTFESWHMTPDSYDIWQIRTFISIMSKKSTRKRNKKGYIITIYIIIGSPFFLAQKFKTTKIPIYIVMHGTVQFTWRTTVIKQIPFILSVFFFFFFWGGGGGGYPKTNVIFLIRNPFLVFHACKNIPTGINSWNAPIDR